MLVKKTAVLARFRLAPEACGEGIERHGTQVLTAACSHGHRSGLLFLVAHHDLVRQLLQAMFPNFIAYLLVSQIFHDPETGLAKPSGDALRIVGLVL